MTPVVISGIVVRIVFAAIIGIRGFQNLTSVRDGKFDIGLVQMGIGFLLISSLYVFPGVPEP